MDKEEKPRVVFDVSRLKLSEVTVFTDRADVQRKLQFSVQNTGRMEVLVENMSQALDASSIRIVCNDVAKLEAASIKKRNRYEDPFRQSNSNETQATLKELLASEQCLLGDFNRAKEQRTMFENAVQHQANQQSLDKLADFLASSTHPLKKMDEGIALLKSRLAQLRKELKAVRKELEELNSKKPRWSVLIELDIVQAGTVDMTLMYAVFSVSWSADYSFMVNSAKRTMQVLYRGVIRQWTGEEWSRVDLRLISSRYGVEEGHMPPLGNWKVVAADPEKGSSVVLGSPIAVVPSPCADSPPLNKASRSHSKDKAEKSVDVEVDYDEGMIKCTFNSFCESILPNGDEHPVVMLTHSLPVELYYECCPRRAQYAFLRAKALNTTGYPMLPGRLLAFLDNSLVASSTFHRVINLRERIECSLGADPSVLVEYKETATTFSGQIIGGFFAKPSISTMFEQRTTVKNRRNGPILVKLIDMIPNGADDSVKVTVNEPNMILLYKQMSGLTYAKEEGCLIWDLYVGPQKEAVALTKYTVQYPTGKVIKLTEKP